MSTTQFSYTVLGEQRLALICLTAQLAKKIKETGVKDHFSVAAHSRVFNFFLSKSVAPPDSVWRQIPHNKRHDLLDDHYSSASNFTSYLSEQGLKKLVTKRCSQWFEEIKRHMSEILFLVPEQSKVAPNKNDSKNNTPASSHSPGKPAKHSAKNTPTPKSAEPKSLLSTKRRCEGAGEHEDEPRVAKRTRLVAPSPGLRQQQQQEQEPQRWLSDEEVARVGRQPQGKKWKSQIAPLRV